jgi:hypothetical protein
MMPRALPFPNRKRAPQKLQGGALGLTVKNAAADLGISVRLLRQAIACDDVKTISFGGRLFIPHREIDRIKGDL